MRTVLLIMILLLSAEVYPQSIKVRSVKNVTPGTGGSYLLSGVVPGSGHLLLAGEGYNGLSLLDPRRGSVTVISNEAGAGYEPSATADGKKIFYRNDFFSENRKYSSTINVPDGEFPEVIPELSSRIAIKTAELIRSKVNRSE